MKEDLLKRLDCLASSLSKQEHCLAFLALGSAADINRLDDYSDLDFFLITEEGYAKSFIDSLAWLETCSSLAYTFRNTIDGYKVMWEDGIYAEFAVFNPSQLSQIPFTEGRFIFNKNPQTIKGSPALSYPKLSQTLEYAFNEIITNLYVGLSRYHRGEKLSAFRLIQVHAVDRYLAMMHLFYEEKPIASDPFSLERRVESRYPLMTSWNQLMLGYDRTLESAHEMLNLLETIQPINPVLKKEIVKLLKPKKS